MRSLRSLLRLFLPALAALLAPGLALGHAELLESDPADGGSIQVAPYTLSATFSEPLNADRSRIRVFDAAGEEVARGGVVAGEPERIEVELPQLALGTYAARWTAVGADGHIERGTFEFTVVEAPATPSPSPAPMGAPTAPTGAPTATPDRPTTPPTPSPPSSPPPTAAATPGGNGQPTAGTSDLLVALLVAAALVGTLAVVLWRRRPA